VIKECCILSISKLLCRSSFCIEVSQIKKVVLKLHLEFSFTAIFFINLRTLCILNLFRWYYIISNEQVLTKLHLYNIAWFFSLEHGFAVQQQSRENEGNVSDLQGGKYWGQCYCYFYFLSDRLIETDSLHLLY